MKKIQSISRALRYLLWPVLFLLPLYEILYWSSNGEPFGIADCLETLPSNLPSIREIPSYMKIVGFFVSLIPLTFTLISAGFLIRLFKCYENLQIFTEKSISTIRKIGFTMLLSQIFHPIYTALISLTMTLHNPPGERMVQVSYGTGEFSALIIALIAYLIAYVMEEGKKLQEEQAYTV